MMGSSSIAPTSSDAPSDEPGTDLMAEQHTTTERLAHNIPQSAQDIPQELSSIVKGPGTATDEAPENGAGGHRGKSSAVPKIKLHRSPSELKETRPNILTRAPKGSSESRQPGSLFARLLGPQSRDKPLERNEGDGLLYTSATTRDTGDPEEVSLNKKTRNLYGEEFHKQCIFTNLNAISDDPQRPKPAIFIIAVHDLAEDNPWVCTPTKGIDHNDPWSWFEDNKQVGDAVSERSHRRYQRNIGDDELGLHRHSREERISPRPSVADLSLQELDLPTAQNRESATRERQDAEPSTDIVLFRHDNTLQDQVQRSTPHKPGAQNRGWARRASEIMGSQLARTATADSDDYRSRPSTGGGTPTDKPIRWLDDHSMLPFILPGARVLKFTYPQPAVEEKNWEIYVFQVAIRLLDRIAEVEKLAGTETPILYIGHGIGGLILQEAVPLRHARQDIDIGYIFLNTPFPWMKDSNSDNKPERRKYGVFPPQQSSRRYSLLKRARVRGLFVDGGLWEHFVREMGPDVERLPVAWLYRTGEKLYPDSYPENMFTPLVGPSSSRFSGPHDRDYQSVVAQIRSLLALYASRSGAHIGLLKMSLRAPDFPHHVRDGRARSLLHLAALHQNLAGLNFVVNQARRGRVVFTNTDYRGRTPLHLAVKTAATLPSSSDHDVARKIIELLVWGISKHRQCDVHGLTPWDYVDLGQEDHSWLHKLRQKYRWVDNVTLKPFSSPDVKQCLACLKSWAIVAEFHTPLSEYNVTCNYGYRSMLDLLYRTGIHQVLLPTRPPDLGKPTFKWIHFPANNRQWVNDLFTGLGLQDNSMENQQRDSSKIPFKYLFPKAEGYVQYKITYLDDNDPYQWPGAPAQHSASASRLSKDPQSAVALFMPFLGYETQGNLDVLDKVIQDIGRGQIVPAVDTQADLAAAYVEHGLHPRRPLDHFSYTSRGTDQVMPTLGWHAKGDSSAPALMVDQLWLWILEDDTVVTCFPDTCDPTAKYNLKAIIHDAITDTSRIGTVEELVGFIISQTIEFFARPGPQDATFVACFQRAINTVAREETLLFNKFNKFAYQITNESIEYSERIRLSKSLLRFDEESSLLMQIRDIQDELNIVWSILEQQKSVLSQLEREAHLFYHSRSKAKRRRVSSWRRRRSSMKRRDTVRFEGPEAPTSRQSDGATLDSILQGSAHTRVDDSIRVVAGMLEYAARIEHSIDHLLDLKQKQANALEARHAREGMEQTRRQGNIMFFWTVITIIFLPMSFLSSFFTINVSEFPKDPAGVTSWPLREVSTYLFGISFALIVPLLVIGVLLGFNRLERRRTLKLWIDGGMRLLGRTLTGFRGTQDSDRSTQAASSTKGHLVHFAGDHFYDDNKTDSSSESGPDSGAEPRWQHSWGRPSEARMPMRTPSEVGGIQDERAAIQITERSGATDHIVPHPSSSRNLEYQTKAGDRSPGETLYRASQESDKRLFKLPRWFKSRVTAPSMVDQDVESGHRVRRSLER